jgi:hypothetical protein
LIKLNEEGIEHLWNNYDTMQLLYAFDALDNVRGIISDDDDFRPPEIRSQLLRIHKLASKRLTGGYRLSDEEVKELSDLVNEVDMTVFGMIEELEKIMKALRPLLDRMFTWEEG